MTYKIEKQGFILLQTLICLSLIASIVLSHIESIFLEKKRFALIQRQTTLFREMDMLMDDYIKKGPPDLGGDFHYTVKKKEIRYQMDWIYLGTFPCLYALGTPHVGTKHWLLRVKSDENDTMGLEVRIAVEAPDTICEDKTHRWLSLGKVSWREIS